MEDVPKIVLKRLQETAAAETHPDANLLTAFAEESLAESERARVVEHLAQCSDCREVVELAVPASESVALVAAAAIASSPSRSGWLNWPGLRWSVAAAGIIAVISIGIVQYRQTRKSETPAPNLMARNAIAAPAAQPSPSTPETQIVILPAEKGKRREAQAETMKKALPNRPNNFNVDRLARPMNPSSSAGRAVQGVRSGAAGGVSGGSGGGVAPAPMPPPLENSAAAGNLRSATPEETAKLAPNLSTNRAVQVPTSSQTVEVESPAAPVTTTRESQASEQVIENQKQQPGQYDSPKAVGVVAAKDFAAAQGASSLLLASPRWGISADGALQRSFDGGKTWADVDVSARPVSSRSKVTSTSENTHAQEKKKPKGQPSAGFRAVSAEGNEVWAGGSASMLYHSADSGAHWARVLPSADGATLTGDVTRIEFSDAQHGRITTSAGEVWITADEGQTWRRQ